MASSSQSIGPLVRGVLRARAQGPLGASSLAWVRAPLSQVRSYADKSSGDESGGKSSGSLLTKIWK